jgi:hypothetical protein
MKKLFGYLLFSVLATLAASFVGAARAATVNLGADDCGGLSRFCYNVPNDGGLIIPMVYTYDGYNDLAEVTIGSDTYMTGPGVVFPPLVPVPNDRDALSYTSPIHPHRG